MAQTDRTQQHRRLRTGDAVLVRIGTRKVTGTVVEDRGALGVGGRRLYRVQVDMEEPLVFELPAQDLELNPRRASRPPAVA